MSKFRIFSGDGSYEDIDAELVVEFIPLQQAHELSIYDLIRVNPSPALSIRAENVLRGMNIETVAQVTELTFYDIVRQRNSGRLTVQYINFVLSTIGLKLKE